MARVTVEDCILAIPNRFELVITAAQRAKQISAGNPLTIDRDNDKDAVVSLREIADKTIDINQIHEDVVQTFQRRHPAEREEAAAKTTETLEVLTEQVEDAFEAVRQQMVMGRGSKDNSGMSFEGDDVQAED